eukprot:309378-Rhodomonas_salina.4
MESCDTSHDSGFNFSQMSCSMSALLCLERVPDRERSRSRWPDGGGVAISGDVTFDNVRRSIPP